MPITAAGVVTGNTTGVLPHYGNGSPGPNCLRAEGRDLVYAITIPAATRLEVSVSPLTNFDVALNLVSNATACGSPGAMTCLASHDSASAGNLEQLSFTNGGPARQVLLIVDGYTARDFGSFALSVAFQPILTGDTCEAPVVLTPGTPLNAQPLTGFNDDYEASFSGRCQFHGNVDRAYSVTVPAGQRLVATVVPTGFDASLNLVQGATNCAAQVCVNGVDDARDDAQERLTWDNVSAMAQTVVLVVDSDSSSSGTGTFNLTATLSAAPTIVVGGDTCTSPTALDAGTFASTTTGRSSRFDFFDNGGCTATSGAPDSVFSVTVPPSSLVLATVTPDGWDAVLNVIASPGACGLSIDAGTVGATCTTSSDGPRTASVEEVVIRNTTTTATTALVVVDGHEQAQSGNFTITTEVIALSTMAGDTCQAPQVIAMSGSLTGLTTANYLDDVQTATSCSAFQNRGPDRVFSIVVPPGKQLTAVVIPNGWDASIILTEASACGMNATCFDASDSSMSGAETARFTNAGTTDRTIFIVVDSYSQSGSGPFDLFTALTP